MRLIIGFVIGVIHTLGILAAFIIGGMVMGWNVADDKNYYKAMCKNFEPWLH